MNFIKDTSIPRIGFLGDPVGLSKAQQKNIKRVCREFVDFHTVVLINDEVGGCEDIQELAERFDFKTYLYPTTNNEWCAMFEEFKDCVFVANKKDVVTAKKNIVSDCDFLFVGPATNNENSDDIWRYVKYARGQKCGIYLFWPNGEINFEQPG